MSHQVLFAFSASIVFLIFHHRKEFDMEATTPFRYVWEPPAYAKESTNPSDKRMPGYIEGYVRRFWQVRENLKPNTRPIWAEKTHSL